jgi:hypothetical protein
MSSEKPNPVADVAEGVTKGAIKVTAEGLKQLVERFLNKDLAFVEDPEIIDIAKEQRKTSEWHLFKDYIDDHETHILFQMGLTLRRLERKKERIGPLRDKIRDNYDTKGLHIAQLIQNGFFNRFLANALERTPTPQQLKFEIKSLLDNIENTVIFVKETDNVDAETQEITIRLMANSPRTFMVCGSGYAKQKCEQIGYTLKQWIRKGAIKYTYEVYETQFKQVFFLNKREE